MSLFDARNLSEEKSDNLFCLRSGNSALKNSHSGLCFINMQAHFFKEIDTESIAVSLDMMSSQF